MDNGLGAEPRDMGRDAEGVWTGTIPPGVPGFHYYWFIVDGLAVNDPGSETFFGYNHQTSAIELPEAPDVAAYYHPQNVPHGDMRIRWYWAKATGTWRQAYICTPPNYDTDVERCYPVLYLQHGGGEDERGWTEPREWSITQRRIVEMDAVGIDYVYWETPDVAHEWLTWRRCLNEFITLLFK
jgi:enterochelin esterase-like enzyme